MTARTSVSVVVPVFNGAETIGDMLAALLSQSGAPGEPEIIVVDNGSTDATRDVVGAYPVTLIEEATRGPSAARNAGLRHAGGDIIAHCDADTVPTRRWLAALTAPFSDESVLLVAGQSLSFPPKTPAERYLSRFQLYDAERNIDREVLPFAASMNLAVRRKAALAVDGWDESMMTSEDVDFCTRLLARFDTAIRYAPDAILFHRNRSTDGGLQRQAWTYGEGVADTYRRYPEIVPWSLPQYLHLARNLVLRTVEPAFLALAGFIGMAEPDDVEYARYHRMWTYWFWSGFFSFYRSGRRREPA